MLSGEKILANNAPDGVGLSLLKDNTWLGAQLMVLAREPNSSGGAALSTQSGGGLSALI